MAPKSKKSKGPKRPQNGGGFNEESLSQLTSKIDQRLTSNDHKRKNPPTDASRSQQPKKIKATGSSKAQNTAKIDREALLAEIKALGGDEKDLDLINDIDSSDDEFVHKNSKTADKRLKDDLLTLSKELGFSNLPAEDASDSDQLDEQDLENEDGDEEDEQDSISADENVSGLDDEGLEEASTESEDEDALNGHDTTPAPPMKKIGNMTFEPRADWHATKLTKLPNPQTDQISPFMDAVTSLKNHALSLLEQDANKYRSSVFASSSHKFLATIMSSGTLTDKVSALTLAIQESPVHNTRAFDALMNMASKKSRAQAIGAIGALVDLLGPGTLLPSGRRLRTFQTQPGLLGTLQRHSVKSWSAAQPLPGKFTQEHLISWAYEDWLKGAYFKIIQLLEVWCSDEIEYSRIRAVDFVYALLKEKPEQEANLLALLVNKLGDRDRKIASRASYLLLQLQTSHPGMKTIIIRTIEQSIILHPTQDHRSKYYAVNTLNQTILSSKDPQVAESLIHIYFGLFVTLLKTGNLGAPAQADPSSKEKGDDNQDNQRRPDGKGVKAGKGAKGTKGPAPVPEAEAADKLVSAILTGVNRAVPFVGANDTIMENHLDTLFRIAHSANFNTAIQALLLIQHLSSARNLATDRFYKTMYESLLDPRLVTSSKQSLYLNLLLRALKSDVDVKRVKAFAKRMLQIAGLHQPPFVCGLLYVVLHLRQSFPDLSTLVDSPEESIFDDDEPGERPVYDGRKRNPEFSNAQRSCLWEMIPILNHYHPSISVTASALLDKEQMTQKPDLDSHSLIRFLDKFVYRNPKATDSSRGASIMQPVRASKDLGDIWLGSRGATAAVTPVNSASFWKKKIEDVAAEDAFFHEYFQQVAKEPKEAKETRTSIDAVDNEDENEDEIWQAMVSAQPDIDEDMSDAGFDDLDELDMASDEGSSPAMSLESHSDDDMGGDSEDDLDSMDGLVAAGEDDGESEEEATSRDDSKNKRASRRKALKDLPMFASVDDYAELLAAEDEDM